MEYIEELKYIQEKISELRIKIEHFRKNSQFKLLKEYKEFVKPGMTNILN